MSKDSPTAKRRNITLAKGWTQERIASVVGMDQTTISRWLDNIPNGHSANASTPKDCRIKLSKEAPKP